jgi:signal peptidase
VRERWERRLAGAAVLPARTVLLALAVLLMWAAVPTGFGWRADAMVSESMAPAVRGGDVLLTRLGPAQRVHTGDIVLLRDPDRPRAALVRRVVGWAPDGALLTRGHSTPVPASTVLGVVRVRVPYLALPAVWWSERDYLALASAAAGLLGLVLVAAGSERRAGRSRPGRHRRHYRGRRRPGPPPTATRLVLAATATIAGTLVWHASAAAFITTAGG